MSGWHLTAGMKAALPGDGRRIYRIGPRMRDVLAVLAYRPWQGSLRALCRMIAEERRVTWRSVAFAVSSLREMGLIEPHPYRLTSAGERYAVRRLGSQAHPARSTGEGVMARPRLPVRVTTRAAPSPPRSHPPLMPRPVSSGPAPPRPQRTTGAPVPLSDWERRCGSCGYDTMALLPGRSRRARCQRCGAERLLE
jgi:hypothetical protein